MAQAQSWIGGRTRPAPGEIVAVDATGETDWLFGMEDVAGDGLDTFMQQERSIDIRSAYANTDAGEFYFRMYVSDSAPPGGNVSGFVFINRDRNVATGGTAVAPEIDARFASADSPGGFEYVFGVQGNGSVLDLWQWDDAANEYTSVTLTGNSANAEVASDLDPLTSSGDEHGYLQGSIELDLVELDANCSADLYFRSLNDTAALGDGDLRVGVVGPCHPADSNDDGVPDRLVPQEGCSADEECPVNAACIGGRCRFTGVCDEGGDCDEGEECNSSGYCVATVGDECSTGSDCSTRVCEGGECVRCDDSSDCAEADHCGADGRCVPESGASSTDGDPGLILSPEEEVQGGACTCGVPRMAGNHSFGLLLLSALLWWRRKQ